MDLRRIHDWSIRPIMRTVPARRRSIRGAASSNSIGGARRSRKKSSKVRRRSPCSRSKTPCAAWQSQCRRRHPPLIAAARESACAASAPRPESRTWSRSSSTPREARPFSCNQVAEVIVGHEIRRGAVTADGKGEIVLGLGFMLMGENSHDVTGRMTAKLEEIEKTPAAGRQDRQALRPQRTGRPRHRDRPQQPVRGRSAGHRRSVYLSRQPPRRADRGSGHSHFLALRVPRHVALRDRRQLAEPRRSRFWPGRRQFGCTHRKRRPPPDARRQPPRQARDRPRRRPRSPARPTLFGELDLHS